MRISKDGVVYECMITPELVEMIQKPDCDPYTRQAILDSATMPTQSVGVLDLNLQEEATSSNTSQNVDSLSVGTSYVPLPSGSGTSRDDNHTLPTTGLKKGGDKSGQTGTSHVHLWTEEEERALLDQRLSKDEQFQSTKNHQLIWADITNNLQDMNIKVTKLQVFNKWVNLKKKYREILDHNNKTGADKQTWKHLDTFDVLFGHKAGTKAAVTYDSSRKGKRLVLQKKASNETEIDEEMPDIKKKKTTLKRRDFQSDIMNKIEKQGDELKETMEQHHEEKMERFDRFLDILENSMHK